MSLPMHDVLRATREDLVQPKLARQIFGTLGLGDVIRGEANHVLFVATEHSDGTSGEIPQIEAAAVLTPEKYSRAGIKIRYPSESQPPQEEVVDELTRQCTQAATRLGLMVSHVEVEQPPKEQPPVFNPLLKI